MSDLDPHLLRKVAYADLVVKVYLARLPRFPSTALALFRLRLLRLPVFKGHDLARLVRPRLLLRGPLPLLADPLALRASLMLPLLVRLCFAFSARSSCVEAQGSFRLARARDAARRIALLLKAAKV
jgi:hypothetical protein